MAAPREWWGGAKVAVIHGPSARSRADCMRSTGWTSTCRWLLSPRECGKWNGNILFPNCLSGDIEGLYMTLLQSKISKESKVLTLTTPNSTMPIRRPPPNNKFPNFIPSQRLPDIHLSPLTLIPRRRHLDINQHKRLMSQPLHAINTMQPPPIPARLLLTLQSPLLRLFPVRMRILRQHHDGKLCVRERRTAIVEQEVDCEFDAGADDPAEGAEVVECDVFK